MRAIRIEQCTDCVHIEIREVADGTKRYCCRKHCIRHDALRRAVVDYFKRATP
jgi:DNA-directed RNA polymerase subunit N (RpoN/RPB10)